MRFTFAAFNVAMKSGSAAPSYPMVLTVVTRPTSVAAARRTNWAEGVKGKCCSIANGSCPERALFATLWSHLSNVNMVRIDGLTSF